MTGLQTRGLALVWLVAFALPIGGALAAGTKPPAELVLPALLVGDRQPAKSVEDLLRVKLAAAHPDQITQCLMERLAKVTRAQAPRACRLAPIVR